MHLNLLEHGEVEWLPGGRDAVAQLLLHCEGPGPVDLLLLLQLYVLVLCVRLRHARPKHSIHQLALVSTSRVSIHFASTIENNLYPGSSHRKTKSHYFSGK